MTSELPRDKGDQGSQTLGEHISHRLQPANDCRAVQQRNEASDS